MSESLMICRLPADVQDRLKKFRFRKNTSTSAIIFKIDKERQEVHVDIELEDCSIDELRDALPDQQPRFILISYQLHHSDGRRSFPLCLVYFIPSGCCPEIQMLYAGSKNNLVKESGVSKVFEIRETDELTDDYLEEMLGTK